jgi:hypothetical protein
MVLVCWWKEKLYLAFPLCWMTPIEAPEPHQMCVPGCQGLMQMGANISLMSEAMTSGLMMVLMMSY